MAATSRHITRNLSTIPPMGRAREERSHSLTSALDMRRDDVVDIVGGGGKTPAMFRLAREATARGGRAITTTTTRIFGAQIALAPAHVQAADATRERVRAALDAHRHVLVVGLTDP